MIFKLTLDFRIVRAFVKHAVECVHLTFDVSLPAIVAKRAVVNRGFSRLFCFGAFPSFEKFDVTGIVKTTLVFSASATSTPKKRNSSFSVTVFSSFSFI